MNIGILTSTDPKLRQQLAANAAAAEAQAQPVANEPVAEVAVVKPRPTVNTAPSVNYPTLRAALDARIAADMSAGQISAGDAATVKASLDAIDGRSDASAGFVSTASFLAGRAPYAAPSADNPAQVARDYLATIDRGTLIDRWA